MRLRALLVIGFCSIAGLLSTLPGLGQVQKPRIKVTVENASVRIKPDAASDVVANPVVGTVYDVEARVGAWYEVKHRTNIGVLVTAYIHEMFVELEKAPEGNAVKERQGRVVPPSVRETPASESAGLAPGIRLGLKLSTLVAFWSGHDYKYDTTLYDETMTITDTFDNAVAMGFNAEIGVFLTRNFELTAGLDILSKNAVGHFGMALPNVYLYKDIATDAADGNPRRRDLEVNFGLNYHIVTGGVLTPYVGLGGAYITAKMDLLEDITYEETYFSDNTHSLKITDVKFVEKTVNKFGFFGRAGLNIEISRIISMFLEGKYVLAKTDVPHPLTSSLDANEKLSLDLGGPTARIGLRVVF